MTAAVPIRPAVYVASPLGFTEAGRHWHAEVLLPALRAAGFAPLDPWDQPGDPIGAALAAGDLAEPASLAALAAANDTVAANNAAMIRGADAVLAVLDGTDVDSGVAAEIGWAAAHGVAVVGLRTDWRTAGDNAAAEVNLQVAWFVTRGGGRIVGELDAALAALGELTASNAVVG